MPSSDISAFLFTHVLRVFRPSITKQNVSTKSSFIRSQKYDKNPTVQDFICSFLPFDLRQKFRELKETLCRAIAFCTQSQDFLASNLVLEQKKYQNLLKLPKEECWKRHKERDLWQAHEIRQPETTSAQNCVNWRPTCQMEILRKLEILRKKL